MTEAFVCDYIRTPIGRFGGCALPWCAPMISAAVPLKCA